MIWWFLVQFTVTFFGSTSDTLTETIMAVEQLFLVVDAVRIISYYVVSSVAQWHLFMSSRLVKTCYSRFALVNNSHEMPGVLLCPHIWLLGGSPHFCWWNSHISSCKFPWFGGQILQLRCSKSEFLLQKYSPSWLIKQVSLKPCSNPWFFPPKKSIFAGETPPFLSPLQPGHSLSENLPDQRKISSFSRWSRSAASGFESNQPGV